MATHKLAVVLIGVLLILVLAYVMWPSLTEIIYQRKVSQATANFSTGQYDATIPALSDLVNEAPDKLSEARVKATLAFSYFNRAGVGDRMVAANIFKAIVRDPAVPPKAQAFALAQLASFYDSTYDEGLMREVVFNDLPYSDILKNSGNEVLEATLRLYQNSDSLFPSSLAKSYLARSYSRQLARNKIEEIYTVATAKLIEDLVAESNSLLDDHPYTVTNISAIHLNHALALQRSHAVLEKRTGEIEREFEAAISVADNDAGDLQSASFAALSRILYARYLANVSHVTRLEDIRRLVQEALPNPRTQAFLVTTGKNDPNDISRIELVKTAQFSIELRDRLIALGWDIH